MRITRYGVLALLAMRAALGGELFRSSFESPSAGSLYSVYSAGNVIDGWTVESGTVEIVGTYWQAALGSQSVDLSGIFEAAGTIYRDVETVPGRDYVLRFAFSVNPLEQDVTKEMKVFWNGVEIADMTRNTAGVSFADMKWTFHQFTVRAESSLTRIKFQSLTYNALGPVIDDVSLTDATTPPPEVTLKARPYTGIWLEGPAGARQQIQVTNDPDRLAGWKTLITLTIPTEGKLFFLDPEPAIGERKFYRTVPAE